MKKPITIIYSASWDREYKAPLSGALNLWNDIEEKLFILWELIPVDSRNWWKNLRAGLSCEYTYHGTEFYTVTYENFTVTVKAK